MRNSIVRVASHFAFAVLACVLGFAITASAGPRTAFDNRPPDQVMLGHTDGVISVAFFPDSIHAASGSLDKTVRIWNTTSGKLERTISGHTGYVFAVAVSPDGKFVASGGADHTVRVWEAATGKQVAQLEGHTGDVRGVGFQPDGTLVSGGADGLRQWNVKTEKLLWRMPRGRAVWSLVLSGDGKRCAFYSSSDGASYVWDFAAQKLLGRFGGTPEDMVATVGITPDGKTIYARASGEEHNLTAFNIDTGKPIDVKVPKWMVYTAFSPDGKYQATYQAGITIYEVATGKALANYDPNSDNVAQQELMNCLAVSPNGKTVLCGGGGRFETDHWEHGRHNAINVCSIPQGPPTGPAAGKP